MLVVISPAKKLNMYQTSRYKTTKPIFIEEANYLVDTVKKLSVETFKNLMKLSPNLAQLNMERFSQFGKQEKKASVLAFSGDTYQGLDAEKFSIEDINWAQDHLVILSGLYGILRPLDLIEPYRLEMGSKLETDKGKTLYSFWDNKLSKSLNSQAEKTNTNLIINCASEEYFKVINNNVLIPKIITPTFMEEREGKTKIISFYAKKARGMMARYIVENRLTDFNQLKLFKNDGYTFQDNLSMDRNLVFIRKNKN